jgi:hypothetical protein
MHLSQLLTENGSGCSVFLDETIAQHHSLAEVNPRPQMLGGGVREPLATAGDGFGIHVNAVQTISNTAESEPAFLRIRRGNTAHQKSQGTKEECSIPASRIQNHELA